MVMLVEDQWIEKLVMQRIEHLYSKDETENPQS